MKLVMTKEETCEVKAMLTRCIALLQEQKAAAYADFAVRHHLTVSIQQLKDAVKAAMAAEHAAQVVSFLDPANEGDVK